MSLPVEAARNWVARTHFGGRRMRIWRDRLVLRHRLTGGTPESVRERRGRRVLSRKPTPAPKHVQTRTTPMTAILAATSGKIARRVKRTPAINGMEASTAAKRPAVARSTMSLTRRTNSRLMSAFPQIAMASRIKIFEVAVRSWIRRDGVVRCYRMIGGRQELCRPAFWWVMSLIFL